MELFNNMHPLISLGGLADLLLLEVVIISLEFVFRLERKRMLLGELLGAHLER